MSAGEFNHLGHFSFGDLVRKNTADTHTVAMDLQHDLHRLVAPFVEKTFENMNDEFHRRVVVVKQEHLVEAGTLGFRARLRDYAGADAVVLARLATVAFFLAHCLTFEEGDVLHRRLSLTAREAGLANHRLQKG